MNKRQRKKNLKKMRVVIADEFNLLTMTDEERSEALKGYKEFVRKHAPVKKYSELKKGPLYYYYSHGNSFKEAIKKVSEAARGKSGGGLMISQSLEDIKRNTY